MNLPPPTPALVKRNPHLYAVQPASNGGVDREADLHNAIMDYCRSKGWLFFHGAMCERTHRTDGEPDFLIFKPGECLLVECKTKTGKLSPAQLAVKAHAAKLGHTVHVVRSIEEFKQL